MIKPKSQLLFNPSISAGDDMNDLSDADRPSLLSAFDCANHADCMHPKVHIPPATHICAGIWHSMLLQAFISYMQLELVPLSRHS